MPLDFVFAEPSTEDQCNHNFCVETRVEAIGYARRAGLFPAQWDQAGWSQLDLPMDFVRDLDDVLWLLRTALHSFFGFHPALTPYWCELARFDGPTIYQLLFLMTDAHGTVTNASPDGFWLSAYGRTGLLQWGRQIFRRDRRPPLVLAMGPAGLERLEIAAPVPEGAEDAEPSPAGDAPSAAEARASDVAAAEQMANLSLQSLGSEEEAIAMVERLAEMAGVRGMEAMVREGERELARRAAAAPEEDDGAGGDTGGG